jgi:hypothetical protein
MLSLLAVFAFSVIAATAAQANPSWIDKTGTKIAASKNILSENVGVLKLTGAAAVECKKESDTGVLKTAGEDETEITFKECHATGKAGCTATGVGISLKGAGEILVKALTALTYAKGSFGSAEEALDSFYPKESTNVFAEFKFLNSTTECGTLSGTEVKVKVTGTARTVDGVSRKCGALAVVGKLEAGAFKRTKAGEVATEGALNLPTIAITESEPEAGKIVSCKLEVAGGAVTETGLVKVETSPLEEFGWTNS